MRSHATLYAAHYKNLSAANFGRTVRGGAEEDSSGAAAAARCLPPILGTEPLSFFFSFANPPAQPHSIPITDRPGPSPRKITRDSHGDRVRGRMRVRARVDPDPRDLWPRRMINHPEPPPPPPPPRVLYTAHTHTYRRTFINYIYMYSVRFRRYRFGTGCSICIYIYIYHYIIYPRVVKIMPTPTV